VWQRPQEYTWRSSQDRQVLYVAPVQLHNWLFQLRGRYRQVQVHRGASSGKLVVLSPLVLSGHFKSRLVHELNCRLIAAHVAGWLHGCTGIRSLVNTPFALRVLQNLFYTPARQARLKRLVYDVIDDFTAFDWCPPFGKQFDQQLLGLADGVLTGTQQLARALHGSVFVPCGVNFQQFTTTASTPGDIGQLTRPIIGYFGTISERIDLELISQLCRSFPRASVVMIGPVHFQNVTMPQHDNLHYLGLKPHDNIPGYAQAFDIGLIPFQLTPATLQLHPVKTLEYLAAGVPVVSTALPEIEQFYQGIVDVAHSREEFIKLVQARLQQRDPVRISAGLERARGASWEAMTERMNQMLFSDEHNAAAANSRAASTQFSPAASS
jgi:glycosyltransferase involved in cell wall biosynthesis